MSVIVLTYATHPGWMFGSFMRSALIHGAAPRVLGWRARGIDPLQGKVTAVRDAIASCADDDVVLFVDGFDVLFADSLDHIISTFRQQSVPMLFSAEKGCWPFLDGRPGGKAVAEQFPASPTPWRFLNSGAYIGYAGSLRTLLASMLALPRAAEGAMDQELAALAYLSGTSRIALDHRCEIFMSVHRSPSDLEFVVDDRGSGQGRWRNTLTGTYPAVLHFNGGAKNDEPLFEARLGYAERRVDPAALGDFEQRILKTHCPSVKTTGAPQPARAPEGRRNAADLILGMAAGVDVRDLEPFILSLKRTGFDGRCRIFLGQHDTDAARLLAEHRVESVAGPLSFALLKRVATRLRLPHRGARLLEHLVLRALQPIGMRAGAAGEWRARRLYSRYAPLHPTALRYWFYLDALCSPDAEDVRRVLLVDTRDVYFQRDPFACAAADLPLCGFSEEREVPIGRCIANADWIRACYGEAALEELKDEPIFCSGAILGARHTVTTYVGALIREIAQLAGRRFVPASGFDQACHNHLLHRSPPVAFTAFANGASPVMHLAHRTRESMRFSPDGELLNDDGSVVNIVHQWDRHQALFQPLVDRLID